MRIKDIIRKEEKTVKLKRLACCFAAFAIISTIAGYQFINDYNYQEASLDDDSYISTLGLPTDDYGFFEI